MVIEVIKVLSLVICAVITVIIVRRCILQGRFMKSLQPLLLAMWPPPDRFSYLATCPVTASDVVHCSFRHKYLGKHEIGLLTTRPIPNPINHPLEHQVDLEIACTVAGCQVFTAKLGDRFEGWWGGGEESGFRLAKYLVPKDLPYAVDIDCTIQVHFISDTFDADYGPLKIYFGMSPEKSVM